MKKNLDSNIDEGITSEIVLWNWGLRENPFEDVEPPKRPKLLIGEKELQKIMLKIQQEYTSGVKKVRIISLVGLPGQGKTHFLKYWKNKLENENAGFVAYLPRPFISRGISVFSATAESILTEELGISRNLLTEAMRDILTNPEKSLQFESNLPYRLICGDLSLNKALKLLVNENRYLSDASFKWIAGLKLLSDERDLLRKEGISVLINQNESSATNDRRSQGLILSLAKVIILFTGKPFYLTIDEMNSLNNLSLNNFRKYLDNLRGLRQGASLLGGSFCIVLACTPRTWAQIERIDNMLAERITKIHFLSGPKSISEIHDFVKYRFQKFREKLPVEANNNEIYPIDQSLIKQLFNKMQESEHTKTWRTIIEILKETLDVFSEDDRRNLESILEEISETVKKRKEFRIQEPEQYSTVDVHLSKYLLAIRDSIKALSRQTNIVEQRLLSLMPFISVPTELQVETGNNADYTIRERLHKVSPFRYSIITIQKRAENLNKIANKLYERNDFNKSQNRFYQAGEILSAAISLCLKPGLWTQAIILSLESIANGYLPAIFLTSNFVEYSKLHNKISKIFDDIKLEYKKNIKLPGMGEIVDVLLVQQFDSRIVEIKNILDEIKNSQNSFDLKLNSKLVKERMKNVTEFQDVFSSFKKNIDKSQLMLRIRMFNENAIMLETWNSIYGPAEEEHKQAYTILSSIKITEEGLSPIIKKIIDEPIVSEKISALVQACQLNSINKEIQENWNEFINMIDIPYKPPGPLVIFGKFIAIICSTFIEIFNSASQDKNKQEKIIDLLEYVYRVAKVYWIDIYSELPNVLHNLS
ncbi:MAG: hypothetical protein ACTSUV_05285 [Candidatus Ranarchaeia archaeon]